MQALTDVALNKPVTQSSYAQFLTLLEKAVDGKRNTAMSVGSCIHTAENDPTPDHWLQVDLEDFFVVHGVVISNKGDCCGCYGAKMDLVFVLDAASSDIEKIKHFVKDFLSIAEIDNGNVRVGIIAFDTVEHVHFHLSQYKNTSDMSTAIGNITYEHGEKRNLEIALRTLVDEMFIAANGDRSNVPNIAIVIAHGLSNINPHKTTRLGKFVREKGIRIYAIGYWYLYPHELDSIASKPAYQNRLNVGPVIPANKVLSAICSGYPLTNFTIYVSEDLSSPIQSFQNSSSVCLHIKGDIAGGTTSHLDCSQPVIGRYVTLALHSNTTPLRLCGMEVLASPASGSEGCESRDLDLVIVLHASSSLFSANYVYLKKQLVWFLSRLDVSSGRVQVGFVVFSSRVHVQLALQTITHKSFRKILETRHLNGSTNTAEALRVVRTQLFSPRNGGRPDVSKLLLLITDENSDINVNNTIHEAFAAKYLDGINIIAVGYGPEDLRQELEAIASAPSARNVFMVNGFPDVGRPLYNLAATLCPLQTRGVPFDDSQNILHPATYIYPPAVLQLNDTLGMSSVEKLGKGQDNCPATHFQCRQGFCIPTYLLNNGIMDCPLGQDENIDNLTCPGFYRCQQTGSCLHPELLCDNSNHCPLNDDERYCKAEKCPDVCDCENQAFQCQSHFPMSDFHFHLRYLDLSGSEKPKLTGIEELVYLRLLNLSSCSFTDVIITQMAQLQILDLSHNNITDFKSLSLISMQELLHLNISFNPLASILGQSFTDFLERARMFKLQTLKMVGVGLHLITSKGLGDLPQLSVLDIRLNTVDVHDTEVFGNSMKELYTDNPKLCCHHFHPIPLTACYAPVNELSSCNDLLKSDILRVLLWVLCAMTLTGNVGVLIYRALLEQQGTSLAYKVFIINLSMADFFMAVYLATIGGADLFFRDIFVLEQLGWQSSAMCKASGFFAMLSSEVSAIVRSLITLDRFCRIYFPFSRHLRLSRFSALLACAIAWITGIVVATVPLSQSHWLFYSQNSICLPLPITQRQFPGQQYTFGIFIVFNFVLFFFIGAGQIMMYRAIRISSEATQRDSRKQDIAVARRLFLIVFTDFCCWFPIGVMGVLAARGTPISDVINVWAAIFVLPLNSAINPFLYTLNTLLERRAKKKERKHMEKFMNSTYMEMCKCPHDKMVEMLRHCRRHKLVEMKVMLVENGDDPITVTCPS